MTATTIQRPPPAPPAPQRSRTAAIVVASVLGVLSLAAVAARRRRAVGRLAARRRRATSRPATHRYTASTSALTTEEIDVDADIPDWLAGDDDIYGDMRLRVAVGDGGPVFAGIARTADVERYLAGASHTEVTDIDTDPFEAEYADHAGARPARRARPARTSGSPPPQGAGQQTLDWDVREGSWSVVVMNAGRLARRRRRRQRRRQGRVPRDARLGPARRRRAPAARRRRRGATRACGGASA